MRRILIAVVMLLCAQLLVAQTAPTINTIAGGGPNNLPATAASLEYPVAYASGYIADSQGYRVYKVDPSTGNLTVAAGSGAEYYGVGGGVVSGDGGPAVNASLGWITSIAVDGAGDLYIGDDDNCLVREVTPNGTINTIAGSLANGCAGTAGDGGLATEATFDDVFSLAVDGNGNLYIGDTCSVRAVSNGTLTVAGTSIASKTITTAAGTGSCGYNGDGSALTSQIYYPEGLAFDTSGDLYLSDTENEIVREVTSIASSPTITTVAGIAQTGGYNGASGSATAVELDWPMGLTLDGSGNLYIADSNNGLIREVSGGTISTIAGTTVMGYAGDGGPAIGALLDYPTDVWADASGNLFVADNYNERIREITGGIINTYAGNGTPFYSGDGYQATDAVLTFDLWWPFLHPAVDNQGNLYIPDIENNVVRKVDAGGNISTFLGSQSQPIYSDAVAIAPAGMYIVDVYNCVLDLLPAGGGSLQTIAGQAGTCEEGGDGGPANAATLDYPMGVAVDASGNVYVSDADGSTVRRINAQTGIIASVANSNSGLDVPAGLAFDSQGDLFIADAEAPAVFELTAQQLASSTPTLAPVTALSSVLQEPTDLVTDSTGNLYVADNYAGVVFKVDTNGNVTTLAGTLNTFGFSGDGGPAAAALLDCPVGLVFDNQSNLLLADGVDSYAARIRKISAPVPLATLSGTSLSWSTPQLVGSTGPAQTVTLTNSGYEPLTVGSASITGNFTIVSDNCSSQTLAGQASCGVSVAYTPSSSGSGSGTLTIPHNAAGSPATVTLSGTAVSGFSLTPVSTSATVSAGSPATFQFSIPSVAGLSAPIALTCSGAPTGATCTVTPSSVNPATGATPVTVNVTTTATTSASVNQHSNWPRGGSALILSSAFLLLPFWSSRRRLERLRIAGLFTIVLAAFLVMPGCGGSGSNNTSKNTGTTTGTPSGTYKLTVTGTSGSLTQAQTVTLKVN